MEHFREVAKRIKNELDEGNFSFKTMSYSELLSIYREVIGYEARISKSVREGIAEALLDFGIRVFPAIEDMEGESVRFFRSNTVLWDIVVNLRYPDNTSDARLAALIKKIKEDPTIEIHVFSK